MLYPVCPTCNTFLMPRQKYYEFELNKLMSQLDIGKIDSIEFTAQKTKLVDEVLPNIHRYCCRARLLTYCSFENIIKNYEK